MCTGVLILLAVCGFGSCILTTTVLVATILIVANDYSNYEYKKGDKIDLGKGIYKVVMARIVEISVIYAKKP